MTRTSWTFLGLTNLMMVQLVIKQKKSVGTPRFTVGIKMTNEADLDAEKVDQPNDKEVVNQFSGELAPNQIAVITKRITRCHFRDYDTQDKLEAAMNGLVAE